MRELKRIGNQKTINQPQFNVIEDNDVECVFTKRKIRNRTCLLQRTGNQEKVQDQVNQLIELKEEYPFLEKYFK